MDKKDVIRLLKERVAKAGTQKALAEEMGVSLPYLNDVLHGRREPGKSILEPLGLKKSYEEE